MDLRRLKDHFPAEDIEWRIGRCGLKNGKPWAMALAYVTARAIHDRLDDVCGPDNWMLEYYEQDVSNKENKITGAIARISILCNSGWVYKEGGSDASDIESFKGCLSGAEKRAGVPWGIGRYLYNLEEKMVKTSETKVDGWNYGSGYDHFSKKKFTFYWETPQLPAWALPDGKARATSIPKPMPVADEEPPDEVYAEDPDTGYEESIGAEEGPADDYDPFSDKEGTEPESFKKEKTLHQKLEEFELEALTVFGGQAPFVDWLEENTRGGISDVSGIENKPQLLYMVKNFNRIYGKEYKEDNYGKGLGIDMEKIKDIQSAGKVFDSQLKKFFSEDENGLKECYQKISGKKEGIKDLFSIKSEKFLNVLKGKLRRYEK